MEYLVVSAAEDFWSYQAFTGAKQGISVADLISDNGTPSRLAATPNDHEALDQISTRCATGDSILVSVNRQAGDGALQVDKEIFQQLFKSLGLNACVLSLLHRSVFGLHQFTRQIENGDTVLDYCLKTDRVTILWLYNSTKAMTRGIMIPHQRREVRKKLYGNTKAIRWKDFFHDANREYRALEHGLGLLWLASVNLVQWLEVALDKEMSIVRQVEAISGHGPYQIKDEANKFADFTVVIKDQTGARDDLDVCSKQTGLSTAMLANVKRQCNYLRTMLQTLVHAKDRDGQPLFEVRDAVGVIEARLQAAEALAEYLSNRLEIQMSVLFNLILQQENKANINLTDASLEVARAARADGGAMKTLALTTILFLPATFLAAFFSMPAFASDQDAVRPRHLRVYFAIATPCTIIVLILSYILTRGRRPARYSAADSAGSRQSNGETNVHQRSPADMEMISH